MCESTSATPEHSRLGKQVKVLTWKMIRSIHDFTIASISKYHSRLQGKLCPLHRFQTMTWRWGRDFSVSITSRFPGLLTKQEQTRWYVIVLAGVPGIEGLVHRECWERGAYPSARISITIICILCSLAFYFTVWVFACSISVHRVCAQCPWRAEVGTDAPGTGVTGGFLLPHDTGTWIQILWKNKYS